MKDCLFCNIIKKEVSAEILYEDEEILGFENIHPEAPIHLLFVPKRHIEWKDKFREKDLFLFGEIISTAKKVAIKKNIFHACKLIFNVGKTGHISHIHLHLLGGWKRKIPLRNV